MAKSALDFIVTIILQLQTVLDFNWLAA